MLSFRVYTVLQTINSSPGNLTCKYHSTLDHTMVVGISLLLFCSRFSHFLLSLLLLACAALALHYIRQRYSSIAQNPRGADINFLSLLTILPFFVLTHTLHWTCTCTYSLKQFSLVFYCCRYILFCSSHTDTTQTQNLLLLLF